MSVFAINTRVSSNGRKSWLVWAAFVIVAVTAQLRNQNNGTNDIHHRRLQVEDGGVSSTTGDSRARYVQKVYINTSILTIPIPTPSLNQRFLPFIQEICSEI